MVDSVVNGGLIPEGPYPTALDSIFEFVKHMEPLRWLGDEDKRSVANGIKILKAYFKHYANDGMEVVRDTNGLPMIEKQVEFLLHVDSELEIYFHGQIDIVLRNKIANTIHYADHKTTASLGKEFYNRINPNHQYTGYVMAGQFRLGIDSSSFMVNGIQVAKTKSEFARQFTERTEEDFAELKQAYITAVRELLACIETNSFPMSSPQSCSTYGGCQFLDACSAPAKLRKNILEGKYNVTINENSTDPAISRNEPSSIPVVEIQRTKPNDNNQEQLHPEGQSSFDESLYS